MDNKKNPNQDPLRNISASPIRRNASEAMLGIRLSDFKLWTGWKTGVFPSAEENRQRDFCVNRTFFVFSSVAVQCTCEGGFCCER